MWLSWSLLIKDDGYTKKAWRLRACSFGHSWCWWNTVDFDGWLRARSFFIDRNITVGSSYLVHEQDRDIWNGKPLIGWVCAMVCAMAVWHVQTHRLPGSDSNDNSFTSGMDFITPIVTGGSATDFSSFRAVLSFSTSLGKELKNNSFGYLKPQLRAVSHSEKPARVTAVLLQAVAFQGWDSSDIRQKELQKHTTSESKWHPVQSL